MTETNTLTAALMATMAILAAIAGPAAVTAAADHDGPDTPVSDLFGEDSATGDPSIAEQIQTAAMAFAKRVSPLGDDAEKADAATYCGRLRSTLNGNASHLTAWINDRTTADSEWDTLRVTCTDEAGGASHLFLTADVNATTGNYSDLRAMNLTEFRDTNRGIDKRFRLSPGASRNANAELETFISEYAKPGENVTKSYVQRMAVRYCGQVTGDSLPNRGSCNPWGDG